MKVDFFHWGSAILILIFGHKKKGYSSKYNAIFIGKSIENINAVLVFSLGKSAGFSFFHWETKVLITHFHWGKLKKSEKVFVVSRCLSHIFEMVITIPINIQKQKRHGNKKSKKTS